jgi:hypothetical protein
MAASAVRLLCSGELVCQCTTDASGNFIDNGVRDRHLDREASAYAVFVNDNSETDYTPTPPLQTADANVLPNPNGQPVRVFTLLIIAKHSSST